MSAHSPPSRPGSPQYNHDAAARRRIAVPTHWSAPVVGFSDRARTGDLLTQGYAPSQLIEDLRKYQAELEIQNQALRYSQEAAEGASERFATCSPTFHWP